MRSYLAWENKALKRQIRNLEDDFEDVAKLLLLAWKRNNLPSITAWLAERFDEWQQAEFSVFELGRVHDVEQAVGLLGHRRMRSEEHTSELQSHLNLVCRLLLEKKKKIRCS